jgi:hypothetical protein
MNSKLMFAAFAALILSSPAMADDASASAPPPAAHKTPMTYLKPAGDSVMTFFHHLKEALSQSAVSGERKKGHQAVSVAAVRGADQSSSRLADLDEPVMIGDAGSTRDKAAMAEDAEFAKAVDLVLAGKSAEGVKALEAFKAAHPKSHSDDVQKAIDQANTLNASAAPAPSGGAPAPAEAPKPDANK